MHIKFFKFFKFIKSWASLLGAFSSGFPLYLSLEREGPAAPLAQARIENIKEILKRRLWRERPAAPLAQARIENIKEILKRRLPEGRPRT